ncbi:MAG: aldo/keto reductase [Balneolaceae bacterium]|nr:aldo/keto reductase [Balneolaceae bacterium]
MAYLPSENRYDQIPYNRCGDSGIRLPLVSLGLWHNFGGVDTLEHARKMIHRAFDLGITHFDLANNYGPPPGSAEENFGRILSTDLANYRDELIISSKAGFLMWPGPYGNWGSRKYLIASLDQSLERMGLDYVDIFYSHRPDPETPLEETMKALDFAVRSGRALYAGISNYGTKRTRKAAEILDDLGTPFLIHQPRYSMFDRWVEEDNLLEALDDIGIGSIVYSPLDQGILTDKYIGGIPEGSRAARESGFLQKEGVTEEKISKVKKLNTIAQNRGQTMAQLALTWVLRKPQVTSALIGASKISHIEDAVAIQWNLELTDEEERQIEEILAA